MQTELAHYIPERFVSSVNSSSYTARRRLPDLASYPGRVTYCLGLLALREGVTRISQEDIAARVEQRIGKRYPQPTVGRWLKRWPKEVEVMVALAEVLGADPGWLYFGPGASSAPAPTLEPSAASAP